MTTISLADAKARLSSFLDRVETGETFVIPRHGRPVAQISAAETVKKPIPFEELAAFRESMPRLPEPSASMIRAMRDEGL
ncbi:type II toxin-antitoxin system prevent-host-death family antitoxin [Aquibium sp. LZ166]|uniref:Antitoxin n=1 Tax=Aquibium pacificus TaxID=3153579 RepID=A0ABV3SEA6_9HYPH